MKKRWHLILIFVLFCFFVYFIFSIADSYYARNKNSKKVIEINSGENKPENSNSSSNNDSTNQEAEAEEIIQPNSFKISVTQSDCNNECSRFRDDNELEYCERICGISDLYDYGDEEEADENSEESPDCSKKEGIKKDYCLKDLAAEESDFKLCEQIIDTAIKKACNNRVLEDLMEEDAEE